MTAVTADPHTLQLIDHLPPHHLERSLIKDVRAGLTAARKTLPPRWFYDARGSELFEQITRLPEYYPTRVERALLVEHATEMAAAGPVETLVELGSGSSAKTPLLLDALGQSGRLRSYVAVDVSSSALAQAHAALSQSHPELTIHAVMADFSTQLHLIPRDGHCMVAFLGGTIGNLRPAERAQFFAEVNALLTTSGGSLLLGAGLVQPAEVLVPAYDDAAGVTADFNRNVLRVLNAELGADFDVEAFEHVAVWDQDKEWIEMRLRATRPMEVHVPGAGLRVHFAEGEEMRTEISAKFRPAGLTAELEAAGLRVSRRWTDARKRYAMVLAEPA